jgi:predicted outer membrane repeat protein
VANSATNGNGGAIALREQENGDHLSSILSSSFEENYSSGLGSAIYGSLALFFNNFDSNNSESGSTIYVPVDGLTAAPLARFSSTFIGNKLNGDLGLFQLCDLSGDYPNISEFNLATDQTCFGESNSNFSTNPDQINQIYANFVPNSFVTTLLNQIEALDLESNYVFKFIQDEIAFDSEMTFRSASSDWSAGDLQRSIDQTPDQNTPDQNTPDQNTPDQNTPDQNTPDQNTPQSNNNLVTSVSAVDRILILKAEEERMAAEKIAAQEAAAKLAAAKKAKKDAAALRSAERKAKLAALLAKLAATKVRGIELKKKSSWINLMKNVSKSTTAKKLVKRSNI